MLTDSGIRYTDVTTLHIGSDNLCMCALLCEPFEVHLFLVVTLKETILIICLFT